MFDSLFKHFQNQDLELSKAECCDQRFWQEGQYGNCNVVTHDGDDIRGVTFIHNDVARRRVIAEHNRIVRKLLTDSSKESR